MTTVSAQNKLFQQLLSDNAQLHGASDGPSGKAYNQDVKDDLTKLDNAIPTRNNYRDTANAIYDREHHIDGWQNEWKSLPPDFQALANSAIGAPLRDPVTGSI